MDTTSKSKNSPLIITGMHRSGTSLVAAFIQALGVDIGKDLLESSYANPKGFFEDVNFLNLQRLILQQCSNAGEIGNPDLTKLENEWLDHSKLKIYAKKAQSLITARNYESQIWGWKDPRTSILLDFWHELIPRAKYVFVYRYPWDVVDSIVRLSDFTNVGIISDACKVWCFYNRRILDFYNQYSEQCLLLNINTFQKYSSQIGELLNNKLALDLLEKSSLYYQIKFSEIYDSSLFKALDWEDPFVKKVQQYVPQCLYLLSELDQVADVPSEFFLSKPENQKESTGFSLSLNSLQQTNFSQIFLSSSKSEPNKLIDLLIIITFNNAVSLAEALQSLQAIPDDITYKIIIVNDSSTDFLPLDSVAVLESKGCVIVNEPNQSLGKAINAGIAFTKARYILRLDTDDKICADYIKRGIEILNKFPEVTIVCGSVGFFDAESGTDFKDIFNPFTLLKCNYISSCAIFRYSLWKDEYGYDEFLLHQECIDWDFWLTALEEGAKFYILPKDESELQTKPNVMRQIYHTQENSRAFTYIFNKHLKLFLSHLTAHQLESHLRYGYIGHTEISSTFLTLTSSSQYLKENAEAAVVDTRLMWQQGEQDEAIFRLRQILRYYPATEIITILCSLSTVTSYSQFLATLHSCLEQYQIKPTNLSLAGVLQSYRQQSAQKLLNVPLQVLENSYRNNTENHVHLENYVHQVLLKNFRSEPSNESQRDFVDNLYGEIAKGFAHPQATQYLLAGLLYYYPHQLPLRWDRLRIPTWFLPEYTKLMLDAPQQFKDINEREQYYQHIQKLVNWLHVNIFRNSTSEIWQQIATILYQNSEKLVLHGCDSVPEIWTKYDDINLFALKLLET